LGPSRGPLPGERDEVVLTSDLESDCVLVIEETSDCAEEVGVAAGLWFWLRLGGLHHQFLYWHGLNHGLDLNYRIRLRLRR
jgi:hypothetical protein